MTSFFRAAANFVGYSGPQHEESAEFVRKLDGFRSHVSEVQKVRDAMQLYSDAAEAMLAAQVVLSEALDSYYQTAAQATAASSSHSSVAAPVAPACHSVAQAYKVSAVEMYGHVRPALREVFVARCVRPATFILAGVPAVHEQIADRKKLIAAFNEVRGAIESQKAYDKQTRSPALLRQEARLAEVTLQLSTLDAALAATLDEFAEARPRMLAQELAAAVACSYHQAQQLSEQLSPLLPQLPQAASSLCLLQAATASRQKRRGSVGAAAQHSGSSSSRAQAEEYVLERAKVAGGRSGGYGLQSSASDSRRRSLRKAPATDVEQHTNAMLLQEEGASNGEAGGGSVQEGDGPAPPPKPPRPT